jgi:hypothetical protein
LRKADHFIGRSFAGERRAVAFDYHRVEVGDVDELGKDCTLPRKRLSEREYDMQKADFRLLSRNEYSTP